MRPRAVRALPVALQQAQQIEVQLAHSQILCRVFGKSAENLDTAIGAVNERVLTRTLSGSATVRRRAASKDLPAELKDGAERAKDRLFPRAAPRGRGTGRRAKL